MMSEVFDKKIVDIIMRETEKFKSEGSSSGSINITELCSVKGFDRNEIEAVLKFLNFEFEEVHVRTRKGNRGNPFWGASEEDEFTVHLEFHFDSFDKKMVDIIMGKIEKCKNARRPTCSINVTKLCVFKGLDMDKIEAFLKFKGFDFETHIMDNIEEDDFTVWFEISLW